MVRNVHERVLAAPAESVGRLLDSLSSSEDRLWPRDAWPPMRLDARLRVGARGGHGPVRYAVTEFTPGRSVTFRFEKPVGFDGQHAFTITDDGPDRCRLRHELVMSTFGWARVTWPLFFRPLHDALIEEALDRAEVATGRSPGPNRRSLWVRILRSLLARSTHPPRTPPEPRVHA